METASPGIIGTMFSIRFLFWLVFLSFLLISAGYKSYQAHSIQPFFEDIGNRLILTSNTLYTESHAIVENNGITCSKDAGLLQYYICVFVTLSRFLLAIMTIYWWIYIFYWLYGHSPLSEPGQWFKNVALGAITYFGLEILALISIAGVNGNIAGWIGQNSITYYITVPFASLWEVVQALKTILLSI